jgi:hypothetical protein
MTGGVSASPFCWASFKLRHLIAGVVRVRTAIRVLGSVGEPIAP